LQKKKEFNSTKLQLENALQSTLSRHGMAFAAIATSVAVRIADNDLEAHGFCSDCALVNYLASLVGFGKSLLCCEEPRLVMLEIMLRRKQGQKGIRTYVNFW
jgi:hypothetical protein